ncbi:MULTISPECIES: hypothetical protein [unclassified Mesorhizobium]|uniref:hypothetical protein n=1 Tax=unclassified Mesorhizobium TaxID=325217 RepID=UPI00192606D6|nr:MULTISPECIES: hypothetical protein [unclassified Mesorhizobium]
MKLHHLHALAGMLAFFLIATFWLGTAATELSGSTAAIAWVKSAILSGMVVLIPALVATGASGFSLGRGMRLPAVVAKKRRMPFIAGNGLLILLPSAIFLATKAEAGAFDTAFYLVQGLELVAGATNLVLIGLNIRDGLAISRRRHASAPRSKAAVRSSISG